MQSISEPSTIHHFRPSWMTWTPVFAVFAITLATFSYHLSKENHFIDESAYISQSYYFDMFINGGRNDAAWLELPALDVPPLLKYMIGASLWACGHPRPGPGDAWAWYHDQSYRPETPAALIVARWPSVVLGAAGCSVIFCLGTRVGGRLVGALAATFLAINPLYRLLARRAMCDVPATVLALATITVAIWSWRRTLDSGWRTVPWITATMVTGLLGGLAVLAKFSGGLGLMTILALAVLALALIPLRAGRGAEAIMVSALLSCWIALGTFVMLNPFVTAHPPSPLPQHLEVQASRGPWERIEEMLRHRRSFSRDQQAWTPDDALLTPRRKISAVISQGFGRYGTLASLKSGPGADRLAWLWGPWVLGGAICLVARGRSQLRKGEPPVAWAVLMASAISILTIAASVPMAWDRYFLPLQPWSSLLAAFAAVELGRYIARATRRILLLLAAGAVVCVLAALYPFIMNNLGPHEIYLSDMNWLSSSNGWGPIEKDASNGENGKGDGRGISIGGVTYAKGLGVHARSEIRVVLDRSYSSFRSDIGVDDEVGQAGSVSFEVWADGRRLYASGTIAGGMSAESIRVNVTGCHELRIVVIDGGDGPHHDHADWAGARLIPDGDIRGGAHRVIGGPVPRPGDRLQ